MLALVEQPNKNNPTPLHYSREKHLRQYWIHLFDKGKELYAQGLGKKAIESFGESLYVSKVLIYTLPKHTSESSGIELYYMSCHNLAACCNAIHQATRAEKILRESYEQVIAICKDANQSSNIRVEALAMLDRSLFSLASQLGYMCQIDRLHLLINEAATIAEDIGEELGISVRR